MIAKNQSQGAVHGLRVMSEARASVKCSLKKKCKMDTACETFICHVCGKSYGKDIYRTKHMKNVHKLNSKGEKIPEEKLPESNKKFTCYLCDKTYNSKSSLQRHVDAIHFIDDRKSLECGHCGYKTTIKSHLKRHIRRRHETHRPTPDRPYKCAHCSATYNHLTSLKHHERKVHKLTNSKPVSFKKKCPLCSFVSTKKTRYEIFAHFKEVHNIPILWETYTFNDMSSFHEWKSNLEVSTTACYVENLKSSRFVCNRRGYYKPQGRNIRPLKKAGTSKINGFCPSEIQIKLLENGQVEAKYLHNHVGHNNELKYIRTNDERKQKIDPQPMNATFHDSILADKEFSRRETCNSSVKNKNKDTQEDVIDGLAEECILNKVCVEIHEENQHESQKRRLQEKIEYFVNYCNEHVKSEEQLTCLEELMEQAMSTVYVMAVTHH